MVLRPKCQIYYCHSHFFFFLKMDIERRMYKLEVKLDYLFEKFEILSDRMDFLLPDPFTGVSITFA